MTLEEFKALCEKRLAECTNLMYGEKHSEYARYGDKLHNFKEAAAMKGESPEKALWGMWVKHIVSIKDTIQDIEESRALSSERVLCAKINDMINYTLLLEGLIRERQKQNEGS